MPQRRPHRTFLPSLLVGVGWALLILNGLEMVDFDFQRSGNLTLRVAETALSSLVRLTVLALAALALTLVAWMHFKHGYARTTVLAALIAAVLAFSLLLPVESPASAFVETADFNTPAYDPYAHQLATEGLITGIVFSSDRPSVVIGAEVLYEGDVKTAMGYIGELGAEKRRLPAIDAFDLRSAKCGGSA